jgi:spore coat protein A
MKITIMEFNYSGGIIMDNFIQQYIQSNQEPEIIVDPSDSESIPKFVDPLPIPPKAEPVSRCEAPKEKDILYHITMNEASHKFHKYFPHTTIWGYNGMYPGPTIEVPKDVKIKVKWENNLPKKHLLPVDHTLHGTMDTPDVRTVVHLHGANVAADSDGHPEAWFTNGNKYVGQKYSREVYEYTNHQAGATLWYHDHAIGITRLNVYAGLAGFYLIRDFLEKRLNLPEGPYEIPLLIQDKQFNKDGSLFYPDNATPPVDNPVPSTPSFFFGNTIVVNGKIWPHLKVEPRKYRFRILNGSNLRAYELKLSNGGVFHQIGTDLGLLHHPVELESFILEPAERIDLIIDFSAYKGQEIILQNNVQGPPSPGMDMIMKFIVGEELKCPDTSTIPKELMPLHSLDPKLAVKERTLYLDESTDHYGRVVHLLNDRMWDAPATEKPKLDTIEIWHLVNKFNFPHPIHLHLVHFDILGRKVFTEKDFDENGNYKFDLNSLDPPSKFERGPKDVVRTEPGQVTSIIMHFKEHSGDYVWHCHILEHEDYDMMRPLIVEK